MDSLFLTYSIKTFQAFEFCGHDMLCDAQILNESISYEFYYITFKSLIMKWVKFKKDFTPSGKLSRLSEAHETPRYYSLLEKIEIKEACFKIYESYEVFMKDYFYKEGELNDHRFHKWVTHKCLPEAYFDEKYKRDLDVEPHPYEIYIGSWLHFYDSEVLNGYSDHAIYFEWNHGRKSVTVYILQLMPPDKRLNINVNVNITNPPGSQDPPKPPTPPPYC